MNWIDLFRTEVIYLYAYEENAAPFLQKVQAHAFRAHTHELLLQLGEAIPPRQARLEVVRVLEGLEPDTTPPMLLLGWGAEVDRLLKGYEPSEALDATILTLVLKALRLRTTCYETTFLLANNLGKEPVANLLFPIWIEVRKADERIASVLESIIESGGRNWDRSLRLSQSE